MMPQQNSIAVNLAWPTTMFMCEWPENAARAPGIVAHLRARAKTFKKPIASGVATAAKSATGLIESPLNLFKTTADPNLLALIAWIDGCVRAAVSRANGGEVPPDRIRIDFCDSWFHITNDGGYHDAHTHGDCSWCGIYYLVAGDSSAAPGTGSERAGNGFNRFYAPLRTGGMAGDYGNAYLGNAYMDIQPIAGQMILFPSYLVHGALPYSGATDRIVLAFNTRSTRL